MIGHDVLIEPEWQLLWPELQKHYEDNSRFVPDVARAVVAWCRSLCELAEDDSNEEWTEQLLEKLKSSHILKILLDVGMRRKVSKTRTNMLGRLQTMVHQHPGRTSMAPLRSASQNPWPLASPGCSLASTESCDRLSRTPKPGLCPIAHLPPTKSWMMASRRLIRPN